MPDTAPRHIAANPLHTILAAYPIAFFTGAMVTDLVYVQTYEMQWANFSVWMIAAGLVMAGLAGVAGIVDAVRYRRQNRPRPGLAHSLGTALVFVIEVINAFVHSRDGYTSVVPLGLTLSVAATILVLVTSWIGFLPVRGTAPAAPAERYPAEVR